MELELIRSAVLAPLPLRDKVLCAAVAAVQPQWRSVKSFGGRQKQKLLVRWSPRDAPSYRGR
jgi:hypothetical protein